MALENLEPVTRMESILNGDNIEPVTREEYFWQQAATSGSGGLPKYTAADVGKVLTVGEDGETAVPVWGGVEIPDLPIVAYQNYALTFKTTAQIGSSTPLMAAIVKDFTNGKPIGDIANRLLASSLLAGNANYVSGSGHDISISLSTVSPMKVSGTLTPVKVSRAIDLNLQTGIGYIRQPNFSDLYGSAIDSSTVDNPSTSDSIRIQYISY